MICVELANRQSHPVDEGRLLEAVRRILSDQQVADAQISLALVNDAEIHTINRQFLAHDEPTDVLSFLLERSEREFLGEIVVSYETAQRVARGYGWDLESELLLYVIHGALHLVGYDDTTPELGREMRRQERHYLLGFGLTPAEESDREESDQENGE